MDLPRIIFLVSGKRKSGKDYTVEKIKQSLVASLRQINIQLLFLNNYNYYFYKDW